VELRSSSVGVEVKGPSWLVVGVLTPLLKNFRFTLDDRCKYVDGLGCAVGAGSLTAEHVGGTSGPGWSAAELVSCREAPGLGCAEGAGSLTAEHVGGTSGPAALVRCTKGPGLLGDPVVLESESSFSESMSTKGNDDEL
jgi:hypothetical protein